MLMTIKIIFNKIKKCKKYKKIQKKFWVKQK